MALDIIYMGTPDFAVPILKAIHESDHNIIHVYTQSPKKRPKAKKIPLLYTNLPTKII